MRSKMKLETEKLNQTINLNENREMTNSLFITVGAAYIGALTLLTFIMFLVS